MALFNSKTDLPKIISMYLPHSENVHIMHSFRMLCATRHEHQGSFARLSTKVKTIPFVFRYSFTDAAPLTDGPCKLKQTAYRKNIVPAPESARCRLSVAH